MATSLNALVLKINADTSGVSAGVRAVRSDVNKINRIMRMTATATDRASDATAALNRVYKTGALTQKEYARGLDAIKKRYGTLGRSATIAGRAVDRVKTAGSAAAASLRRASTSMGAFVAAAAGLVGIAKGIGAIKTSFAEIDQLAKTSDKLGIATEKLGALRFAAEETGVATSTLDMALQRMVRRVAEAGQGTGEAKNAIAELGLNAQALARMTPDEQFKAIADAMSGVGNQSDQLRLAFKLFDSEGAALVNTLRIGRDGLNDYEEAANRLGIAINRFDAAQIEKANDAFGRIGMVVDGLINQIAIGLAPVVEGLSKSITNWATSSEKSSLKMSGHLEGVAKSVGFVRDGIELWIRVFKSVRAYIAEFFSWMATQTAAMAEKLADLLNKIPGVETAPLEFTGAFADEMKAQAEKARQEADKAWAKPFPSVGVDQFFQGIRDNINKSRAEFDELAKQRDQQRQEQQGLQSVAQIGQAIQNSVSAFGKFLSLSSQQDQKPIKVELPPAAQKGSREEFALMRQMQEQATRKASSQQEKQTGLLAAIGTGVAEMVRGDTENKGLFEELIAAVKELDFAESV